MKKEMLGHGKRLRAFEVSRFILDIGETLSSHKLANHKKSVICSGPGNECESDRFQNLIPG